MSPRVSQYERERAQSLRVWPLGFSRGSACGIVRSVGYTTKPMPAHCHTCTPSPVRRPTPNRPAHYCARHPSRLFSVTAAESLRMWDVREGSRSSNERVNPCKSSNSQSQLPQSHSSQAASAPTPSVPLRALLQAQSSLTQRAVAPRPAPSSAARRARSAMTQASATNQNQHRALGPNAFTTPLPATAGRGFAC